MRRLLILSGGHPYEAEPFAAMLRSLEGWSIDHRAHPQAEIDVAAGTADGAGAILFYDMGGYAFGEGRVETRPPSPEYRAAVARWFDRGGGAVAMHHALAGWADWPEWGEWLGGRFLYRPERVRGADRLDSGYRHDVDYQARVVAPDHPVAAGLPERFPLRDELYLAEVFEEDVTPLLRADHAFVADGFYSAAQAVAGRMFSNQGWAHPPGSDLVAWAKPVGAGRLVYLQPGDGPEAYGNPNVRRLLANALEWVAA